jgi:hypothetical protein
MAVSIVAMFTGVKASPWNVIVANVAGATLMAKKSPGGIAVAAISASTPTRPSTSMAP